MSNVSAALEAIVSSPQLPRHLHYLGELLESEKQRRRRFYEEIDENMKAEFINGQVVLHSPVRLEHLDASALISSLLIQFVIRHNLGRVFVEKCLIQCERNAYEPDICFFGQVKVADLKQGQKIFPPPDLIVEILSPSTAKNDQNLKLEDYALHGVAEYWIVDADQRIIEQYILEPGAETYSPRARVEATGVLASVVLTGFKITPAAIFDSQENQRALLTLLQS